jgi:hypothetical protein
MNTNILEADINESLQTSPSSNTEPETAEEPKAQVGQQEAGQEEPKAESSQQQEQQEEQAGTLMNKIMRICDAQMACADVFCPYLACSFAAHIFNLRNQVANIVSNGVVPHNVKLNIIMVSPPGLSKNESIYRFIGKGEYSLLTVLDGELDRLPDGTPAPFCKIAGEISGAGFVGTTKGKKDDEEDNEEYGDAFLYRKGILAYIEIASLFIKSEHSQDLINHVLRVMGDNQIVKRLGHIDITHDTYATIWGGIQPERIKNIDNSGMDRRALYLFHHWTDEETQKIKNFIVHKKTAQEVEDLKHDISSIRNDILEFVERVKLIDTINWHFDRENYAIMPADINLIEGLCIGYALLTEEEGSVSTTLEIRLTPELEKMLFDIQTMKVDMKVSTKYRIDSNEMIHLKNTPIGIPEDEDMIVDIEHPELNKHTVEGIHAKNKIKKPELKLATTRDVMQQLITNKEVYARHNNKNRKIYYRI